MTTKIRKRKKEYELVKITKEQADFLIENGHLTNKEGKYPDLQITCRQKGSKRKSYFVPDYLAKKLS